MACINTLIGFQGGTFLAQLFSVVASQRLQHEQSNTGVLRSCNLDMITVLRVSALALDFYILGLVEGTMKIDEMTRDLYSHSLRSRPLLLADLAISKSRRSSFIVRTSQTVSLPMGLCEVW